ncbi:hypothetical protein [Cellvibrio sp. pealriver]|uniref:hypothetical protein n=1 Tax=Cellvibrio sp. pealriver TaxID=1622269 RepID=UPI00066FDF91|nr:hypothetical protein [Cellvibrio sp. pealriver]
MEPKKVFSPHQVYVGSFIGGPLCATHLIYKNFIVMAKPKYALITILIGVAFMTFLLLPINFLPEKLPYITFPLLYSGIAGAIVWQFQVSKEEEAVNEEYSFISNWLVAKYSAIYLLVTVLLFLATFYGYSLFGYSYA